MSSFTGGPHSDSAHTSNRDTQTAASSLTAFQRDILAILASGPQHGLAIMDQLSDYYGEDINHGRLYPNLDTLADEGWIEKERNARDNRTNEYRLSDDGRQLLEARLDWVLSHLEGDA